LDQDLQVRRQRVEADQLWPALAESFQERTDDRRLCGLLRVIDIVRQRRERQRHASEQLLQDVVVDPPEDPVVPGRGPRAGGIGLGDQDAGSHGLFVDFFGHPASTFKSIALLALRYQALICVGYAIRLDSDDGPERFEVGCEELIDPATFDGSDPVTDLTRAYTQALERIVRRAPEQYFWLHRRWKSKPDRQRRRSRRKRSGRLPWAA